MRTYSVAEADHRFREMLDLVKSGEVIAVTENGERIAELHPSLQSGVHRVSFDILMREIKDFRTHVSPTTIDELSDWRREGQKG